MSSLQERLAASRRASLGDVATAAAGADKAATTLTARLAASRRNSSSPATTRVGAFAASSSAAAAAARSSIDISPASSGSIVTERESGGRCDVTGAAGAAWCERPPKGDGINAVPALHAVSYTHLTLPTKRIV